MSVVGFIPARGNSKGIQDKNIIIIAGKPLIYWACQALQNSTKIDKFIVATDSEKIKNTVLSFKFSKLEIYDRNPQNATDTSPTIDVVLEYFQNSDIKKEDLFCLVQATSPLVTPDDIDICIEKCLTNNVSIFSGVEFPRICWTKSGEPLFHDLNNRKRRQDSNAQIVVENGAIYCNSVQSIIENKRLLTGEITPHIMPPKTLTEIDEVEDIKIVEKLLKKQQPFDGSKYKAFIMDCDGVLTDGGMYYSEEGEQLKKFNTNDGMGIAILKNKGFYIGILTGEDTRFAKERAKKLNIECFSGVKDKLTCVRELANKLNIDLSEIIYMGDDLNDLEVIKNVGFSACPNNAQNIIKDNVNYITNLSGGCGAVREFINYIVGDCEND